MMTTDTPDRGDAAGGTDDQPPQLTIGEYIDFLDLLASAYRLVAMVPVDRLRNAHSLVSTMGPMLEPTAYMRGGSTNLDDQADMIRAAEQVQAAIARIRARHPEMETTTP